MPFGAKAKAKISKFENKVSIIKTPLNLKIKFLLCKTPLQTFSTATKINTTSKEPVVVLTSAMPIGNSLFLSPIVLIIHPIPSIGRGLSNQSINRRYYRNQIELTASNLNLSHIYLSVQILALLTFLLFYCQHRRTATSEHQFYSTSMGRRGPVTRREELVGDFYCQLIRGPSHDFVDRELTSSTALLQRTGKPTVISFYNDGTF